MAVTAKLYGLALKSLVNKEIDFDTDTVKHMLTTSSYVPDQDTHQYLTDVTDEITGTGYTAGGVTAAGKTVTYDTALNKLILDCDDPTWATTTFTARRMVTYIDTGTAATSPLLCWMDFGSDQTTSGVPFEVTLSPSGLVAITAA